MKQLLMGNEAIAMGALCAGVGVVAGYPGTPSTEVLETVAKRAGESVSVQWSVNEKVALEVAAGASYAGARVMVTMKQVGLNVASDPLMSLNYIGIKGGMVILVADDPGPISSQTEQDTRLFGRFARVPVFDPEGPEEAFALVSKAFDYSEKYNTPVILRPTTRVCHSCAEIDVPELPAPVKPEGFVKDTLHWVIFPRIAHQNKIKLFERETSLGKDFSESGLNPLHGNGRMGIACGGVSRAYVKEIVQRAGIDVRLFEVATPFPFPADAALEFLKSVDSVLVCEELEPVIEDSLALVCQRNGVNVPILGKRTGHMQTAGENTAPAFIKAVCDYIGAKLPAPVAPDDTPQLPPRPPVLCAGCPHRGSFYAVKAAMKGRKAVFSGDIGCYTLGNAQPLDMVDTCLCMGAGITIAQGLQIAEPDALHFAFVGDSTFFHTGIPGVINAVYNQTDIILCVLDNATTAMTGHQPDPGTGKSARGTVAPQLDIEAVLRALGVESIQTVDPMNYAASLSAVKLASEQTGVRAIIFRSPCIALSRPVKHYYVAQDDCIGCKKCLRELGCPALRLTADGKKMDIDPALCTGCGLCNQICPVHCMLDEPNT